MKIYVQPLTDTGMVNSYFIPCSCSRFSICQANVVKVRISIQFITCPTGARIWAIRVINTFTAASSITNRTFFNICENEIIVSTNCKLQICFNEISTSTIYSQTWYIIGKHRLQSSAIQNITNLRPSFQVCDLNIFLGGDCTKVTYMYYYVHYTKVS